MIGVEFSHPAREFWSTATHSAVCLLQIQVMIAGSGPTTSNSNPQGEKNEETKCSANYVSCGDCCLDGPSTGQYRSEQRRVEWQLRIHIQRDDHRGQRRLHSLRRCGKIH